MFCQREGFRLKENKNFKKSIYQDCKKAMLPTVVFYSLCDISGGVISVYTASIFGDMADAVFANDLSNGLINISKLILCILVSLLIVPLIGMVGEIFMFSNALKHDRIVYSRFLDKSYREAMMIEEGEVQYRLERDANEFRYYWMNIIEKCLTVVIVTPILLSITLRISMLYTAVILGILVLKLIVPMVVKKKQAEFEREQMNYNTQVRVYETEITRKPHVVKLYGLKNKLVRRLDELFLEYFKNIFCKKMKYNTLVKYILEFSDKVCSIVVLLFGAFLVSKGDVTAGMVASMLGYLAVFNTIITSLDGIIRQSHLLGNLSERLSILYGGREIDRDLEIDHVEQIEIDKVSFRYVDKTVINNISFQIKKGDKIAICGVNGSGKTTLLKIISGLINGYEGIIKLNELDMNKISISSWRRHFAYVLQEPYLFEGTVKENIRLGNLAVQEEHLNDIIRQMKLEHIADKMISVKGNELSGGEMQKISIARALVKGTEYVILDEPNNNLDVIGADYINDYVRDSDRTILYVTHGRIYDNTDYIINL